MYKKSIIFFAIASLCCFSTGLTKPSQNEKNIINRMGPKKLAEIALNAYLINKIAVDYQVPEGIKTNIDAETKARADFNDQEYPKVYPYPWNKKASKSIGQFHEYKESMPYLLRYLLSQRGSDFKKQAKQFNDDLKAITKKNFAAHATFYETSRTRYSHLPESGTDLLNKIEQFIKDELVVQHIDALFDQQKLEQIAVLSVAEIVYPKTTGIRRLWKKADDQYIARYYSSLLEHIFRLVDEKVNQSFFSRHKVIITAITITAAVAIGTYYALGEDRRAQIGRDYSEKGVRAGVESLGKNLKDLGRSAAQKIRNWRHKKEWEVESRNREERDINAMNTFHSRLLTTFRYHDDDIPWFVALDNGLEEAIYDTRVNIKEYAREHEMSVQDVVDRVLNTPRGVLHIDAITITEPLYKFKNNVYQRRHIAVNVSDIIRRAAGNIDQAIGAERQ